MAKGRKQSKESKLLDISMDLTSILLNANDKENVRKMIDKYDDERRQEKRLKEVELLEKLDSCLGIIFETSLMTGNNLCSSLSLFIDKFAEYREFVEIENEKEDYFENLDDGNREGMINYLSEKLEEVRDDNEIIQLMILHKRGNE